MSKKPCLIYFDEPLVEEIKARTAFIRLTEQPAELWGQLHLLKQIVHSNEVFAETSGISEVTLAPKAEIPVPPFGKLGGGFTLKWTLCRICQMSSVDALLTLYKLMKDRELDKVVSDTVMNPKEVDAENLYFVGKIVKLKGIVGSRYGRDVSCSASTLNIIFAEDQVLDISLRQPNRLRDQVMMLIDRPISIIGRIEHVARPVSLVAAAIFLEPTNGKA